MTERNVAILALKSENKNDNSLEIFIKIDPKYEYFKATAKGYKYHKK